MLIGPIEYWLVGNLYYKNEILINPGKHIFLVEASKHRHLEKFHYWPETVLQTPRKISSEPENMAGSRRLEKIHYWLERRQVPDIKHFSKV